MSTNLYNNVNYNCNLECILSEYIREYDISKANINMLLKYGAINQELYNKLYNSDKLYREIFVGKMVTQDHNIYNVIGNGIKQAKKDLFEVNNINDEDIISIRNDAVFILNKNIETTRLDDYTNFSLKNTYTSYYNLGYYEMYYMYSSIDKFEKIDIKGIKDDNLNKIMPLHKDYFIDFLLELFNCAQTDTLENTINLLCGFYNKYINRELPIEYYREFTTNSFYSIIDIFGNSTMKYNVDNLSQDNINFVDISFNLDILNKLHGIYARQLKSRKFL